ncbi:MAG: hypothetical protein Q8M77_06940 [Hydrogenophaga sp.]|nr:hypothetical protein [Hydrogenophaga sp.]
MPETSTTSQPPSPHAKRLTWIGAAFIALAFIGPYLAASMGFGEMSAFKAGADGARTLGSLLLLALVAWAVSRGRSDTFKASARVAVGVLLCIVVGSNIAQTAKEVRDQKAFLADALVFRDQQALKFAKLGERFDAVDLGKILTPQSMVLRDDHAAARATLATYRALLAERRALVQTYLLEYERFVADRALSYDAKAGAQEGMKGTRESTEALYASLDDVQTGLADSMERVLDWGVTQAGKLNIQNGQLMFTSTRQQAELDALLVKVAAAETKMNEAQVAAQRVQQKAQKDMADHNRQAAEILRK